MSIPSFLRHRHRHRKNELTLNWQWINPDTSDLANAKIALTFLRLAQQFSSVLSNSHHYDHAVAKLLSPAILTCTSELKALHTSLKKACEDSAVGPEATPEQLLLCDDGQQWLGNAANKQAASHRKLFAAAEHQLSALLVKRQPQLPRNLALLQSLMQFTHAEIGFIELGMALEHAALDFDIFGFISKTLRIKQALAELGLVNDAKGKWLLHERGTLVTSGLFEDLAHKHQDLGDLLKLSKLGTTLITEPFDSLEAMASAVLEPFLSKNDTSPVLTWPHLDTEQAHLKNVLGHVLKLRTNSQFAGSQCAPPERGINIMLHGGPGTGKTEFAKRLCSQLADTYGAAAYAVTAKDDDGDAASRTERLASLRLSQKLAGHTAAILVLDEAEDIFQSDYNNPLAALFKSSSNEGEGKAWMNQMLETNEHPVIWISNRIAHLDPAYLRRFTYVVEFKNPPRSQRLAIAEQHLAPAGASTHLLEQLSYNEQLTPAMLASAAKFVRLLGQQQGMQDAPIQHHLQVQLKAMGKTATSQTPQLVTRFDTRYLNASGRHSAQRIAEALARTRRGTVLLTGMPGTGKTQLAAHMAERCNMELVYRTAADINDMYYGQSERNVAQLFDNCDIHNQIIFLDEADTLLMARSEDSHRADRAVTSEFLRRLEAFQGIFMCATNHGDLLDPALMRRFVFRLDLEPASQIQRTNLLQELLKGTNTVIDDCTQQRLNRLDRLTPGDFANCKKRLTCLDENPSAEQWLDELEQEHNVKPLVRGRVGFV